MCERARSTVSFAEYKTGLLIKCSYTYFARLTDKQLSIVEATSEAALKDTLWGMLSLLILSKNPLESIVKSTE